LKISNEFKVGLLAVISILLFIFGYNYLKGNNLLKNSRTFYAVYDNVEGLSKSSPVTINGLQIGSITDINFLDETGKLVVSMNINNDFVFSSNSVAKIYGGNLIGSKSMAIEPVYQQDNIAKSGDTLPGKIDPGLLELVNNRLTPLQSRVETAVTDVDTLITSVNKILNPKTQKSIQESFININSTLNSLKNTSQEINELVANNHNNINKSFENINKTTENLQQVSDSVAQIDVTKMSQDLEKSIANIKEVTKKIENSDGTLGKLIHDDQLYKNLEGASNEMQELLNDIKTNPKRYVHFSVFGKKNRPYKKNNE
jgi:phospholipid/cholesterol/gamma-HCH transport system substrate-binding protein